MHEIYDIPQSQWNGGLLQLRKSTAVAGINTRMDRRADCIIVHAEKIEPWQHPWWTTARWDGFVAGWRVKVRPGFVNGVDPLFNATPLLDAPEPQVRTFREVGGQHGDETSPVPAFFQKLGVPKPLRGDQLPPLGARRLLACDIVLAVARPSLTGAVQVADAGESGQVAQYAVDFDTSVLDAVGARPRLRMEYKFTPAQPPTLEERLLGLFDDTGEDASLISTLFLLSPPDAPADAVPDATWSPFAQYSPLGFWNVAHASRNVRPPQTPAPIRLFTGLLGGLGDSIANQLLAQINDFADRVSLALNATTLEGRFWSV